MSIRKLAGLACALVTLTSAEAASVSPPVKPASVQIAEDSGGEIIQYLLKQVQFRESHTQLQFIGRCDSACTLYLGLPPSQLCLTQDAYFRFHLPIADDAQTVQDATRILLMKYPPWVRSWIKTNHGLSTELITMDYAYASRFLKPCATQAKSAT